jgi:hypothetical protein
MYAAHYVFAYAPTTVPTSALTAQPLMSAENFKVFVDSNVADTTLEKSWDSDEISDKAGLIALAKNLNPVVGYWDPLNIGETSKENIAWFRHAEIKHGRVAMAAFVGYTVQSLGVYFPWNLQAPLGLAVPSDTKVISFADISAAGGPADQWDALPSSAKVQILMAVGFLELVSEASVFLEMDGTKHYVRGGKPGYFPTLTDKMPHPVPLNFWDPFGLTKKMTPERKEQALLAEINNGRWAMLGIMGCISASKGLIVPGLDSLPIKPYGGEIMAPFSGNPDLPFVTEMLALRAEQIAREAAILGDAYLNNGA